MPSRPGSRWNRDSIGVRHGHGRGKQTSADPAEGARIPRCRACGLPNPIDMIGSRGGVPGRFPICDRCWFEVNPPDPLTVEAA